MIISNSGKIRVILACLILTCWAKPVRAQASDTLNRPRLNTFLIATGVTYTVALIALNDVWYSDYPRENFHFFNDSKEWKQMDKIGHYYTAFHLSNASNTAFRWAGVSSTKSALLGSLLGFALMFPIEIMDGFSSEYGASGSDLAANFLGSGFFLGQSLLWNEIRIHPKYSYSESGIATYRPGLLGKNYREKWLKDYNGQIYWLSFDLHALAGTKPKWLNLALGYGVNNMINASGTSTSEFPYASYRQYFFAVDFDFTYIKTKSTFLNTMLFIVNMIHLPAPALEYNKIDKLIFHSLHF